MTNFELIKKAAEIRKYLFGMTTYIVRNEQINPYYGRTDSGLTLIQYYGCPGNIGTPLGQWAVDGGGCDNNKDAWLEKAKDRLGLTVLVPQYYDSGPLGGEVGPIWGITCDLDGNELPKPVIHVDRGFEFVESERLRIGDLFQKLGDDWKITSFDIGL